MWSIHYRRWVNMMDRCYNEHSKEYKNYGGRGIFVANDWHNIHTYVKDISEGHFQDAELDRINNDGWYSKDNCRWVTRSENIKNSRRARRIRFKGVTKNLGEWADELGIDPSSLIERLDKWPIERALTEPKNHKLECAKAARIARKNRVRDTRKKVIYSGDEFTIAELSEISGISAKLLRKRIFERGWPVEKAAETKPLK